MAAIWTEYIGARDGAGRLVGKQMKQTMPPDNALEYHVSSGGGTQKSEFGCMLKEEPQDLLVCCEVCEKDKPGMLSSSLGWATG